MARCAWLWDHGAVLIVEGEASPACLEKGVSRAPVRLLGLCVSNRQIHLPRRLLTPSQTVAKAVHATWVWLVNWIQSRTNSYRRLTGLENIPLRLFGKVRLALLRRFMPLFSILFILFDYECLDSGSWPWWVVSLFLVYLIFILLFLLQLLLILLHASHG